MSREGRKEKEKGKEREWYGNVERYRLGQTSQGEWVHVWFVNILAIGLRKVFGNIKGDMKCAYTVFSARRKAGPNWASYIACVSMTTRCDIAALHPYFIIASCWRTQG